MKKQEAKKLNKVWLWLCIALVVLAAAVTAVLVFLPGQGPAQDPVRQSTKLYWNVDRMDYVGQGISDVDFKVTSRSAVGGEYTIRFAVDGEKINYKCDNKDLVVHMDMRDVMGLVFDDRGYIVDMVYPEDMGYSVAVDRYHVVSVEGSTVDLISNIIGSGTEKTIQISEATEIYSISDADGSGLMVGVPASLEVADQIVAMQDAEGNITHIWTDPYRVPGDLYYNTERMYDTTLKMTTRQPDTLGYYNFTFALNGQQVELRTKDQAVANTVDAVSSQWMGLTFDDDGNITGTLTVKQVTGGGGNALKYNVQSIEDEGEKYLVHLLGVATDQYQQGRYRIDKDCPVYDVSGAGDYIGQATELRVGDRASAITDCRGEVCMIFVSRRANLWEYYYNLEQRYDSEAGESTRTPDAEGYYYFNMSHEGQDVTVKCNNKAWVDFIDSQGTNIVGLIVENGQIVRIPVSGAQVLAGYYLASGWGVQSFDETQITVEKLTGDDAGTTAQGKLAENYLVYNVCPSAGKIGEITQLQVGDKVRAYTNHKGEVEVIYVITRGMDSPVYRKLKALGQKEDGYTYFLMAVNGKQITVKAKDPAVLKVLNSSKSLALYLTGDNVVYKAASALYAKGYTGGLFANGATYTGISDGVISATMDGKTLTAKLAANYEIYDVSTTGIRGGKATTLRYGDVIQCFKNMKGEVVLIYVTGRDAHKGVSHCTCYGAENVDHSKCEDVTYQPIPKAENYVITITKSGNYYLTGDTAATLKLEEGVTVNLCLAGFGFYGRTPISVAEGATLNITDCLGDGYICSTSPTNGGYAIRVFGGTVNLYSGMLVGVQPGYPERVNKVVQVSRGVFNMYGGTIKDGVLNSGNGANLYIIAGTANLYGGTIENGKAVLGNDTYVQSGGTLNLGGTIRAGQIYIAKGAAFGFLDSFDSEKASASIGLADMSATFAIGTAKAEYVKALKSLEADYTVAYDKAAQGLYMDLTATDGHIHCLCGGQIEGHSCRKAKLTTALTQAMFTDGTVKVDTYTEKEEDRQVYVLESGTYYLAEDITLDKEILLKGKNVTLCLNGHTIQNTVYNVFATTGGGQLTVTDCVGTGVITGSGSFTNEGGAIRVAGTSDVLNLYAGKLTVAQSAKLTNGGVVACSGTFNMYGGTVTGGSANNNGGNINLGAVGSVLNLYGGTVTGGTAGGQGGNISGRYNAATGKGGTINLYGGIISDGTAAAGDDVYAAGVTTIGAVKAEELFMAATATVSLNESFDEKVTNVGINAAEAVKAQITGLTKDVTANFPSTNSDYASAYADGKLVFKAKQHEHCVCTGSDEADHSQCQSVVWQPAVVSNNAITITESGHYYLTGTRTQRLDITGATAEKPIVVDLCLNGYIMRANTPIVVGENVTVNICDHTGDGYVTSTNDQNIGCAVRVNGGTVNFYSGTLHGSRQDAGNTHIQNRAVEVLAGQFNMYGGTVTTGVKDGGNGGNVYVSGGQFTMLGGTVTGGTAQTGDNVYVGGTGSITLGGTAKICDEDTSNLFLADGIKLTVSTEVPFSADARISISVPDTAVVAQNVSVADAAHLVQDTGFEFNYTAGTVTISVPEDPNAHKHCLCNGTQPLGHASCTNVTFETALTQAMFDNAGAEGVVTLGTYNKDSSGEREVYTLASGTYYLTEDITIDKEIALIAKDVKLCLNGFSLTDTVLNVFTLNSSAKLSICDHTGGELVGSGSASNEGGVVRVTGGNDVLNLYGGSLRLDANATAMTNGGVVALSGQFNMYGGQLSGGRATGNGGTVNMAANNSVFNMYGGSISGGFAGNRGGNLSGAKTATKMTTMNLYGGTIEGGSSNGNGQDIYAGGTITIGQAAAGQVWLNDITMGLNEHFDATKASASVRLKTVAADAVVITGAETDCTSCFTVEGADNYTLTWIESDKTLVLKGNTPADDGKHRHCWCVNAAVNPADHVCDDTIVWNDAKDYYDGNTIKITQGGYYFMSEGSSEGANKSLSIDTTEKVYLCLNGKWLNAMRPIALEAGDDLTLCDCADTGKVTSSRNFADSTSGRCVLMSGGKFTLISGILDASLNKKATRNVEITGGEFAMYGGQISGGSCSNGGGNVYLNGGSFNMYGGQIKDGQATGSNKHGGNVFVNKGTFTMHDGTISGGKATGKGGNVMVIAQSSSAVAEFIMRDGSILGGLTEGNNAQRGGNVCLNTSSGVSKFTMNGGTVSGGRASIEGGNVYLYSNADELTVIDGTICDGVAPTGMDVFVRNGSVVVGGSAAIGNVYLSTGKTMTVSDQKALTGTDSIGVTTQTVPAAGESVTVATGAADANAFFTGMTGCKVEFANGEVILVPGP